MKLSLEPVQIQCPYCWESFDIVVDLSVEEQSYVEDCFVCCRPIHLHILVDEEGEPNVRALSDDDY